MTSLLPASNNNKEEERDADNDNGSVDTAFGLLAWFDWNEVNEDFVFPSSSSSSSSKSLSKSSDSTEAETNSIPSQSTVTANITPLSSSSSETQPREPTRSTTTESSKRKGDKDSSKVAMKKRREQLKQQRDLTKREQKVSALIQMPRSFLNLLNSGKFDLLDAFITKHFAENCEFQNACLADPVIGRSKICEMYRHLAESFPDCVWVIEEVGFDDFRGVLLTRILFSGTKCAIVDSPEAVPIDQFEITNHEGKPDLQKKLMKLIRLGRRISVKIEVTWIMFVDAYLTTVHKFHARNRVLEAEEAPLIPV